MQEQSQNLRLLHTSIYIYIHFADGRKYQKQWWLNKQKRGLIRSLEVIVCKSSAYSMILEYVTFYWMARHIIKNIAKNIARRKEC